MRFFAIFILTFTIAVNSAFGQAATQNPSVFTQDTGNSAISSVDSGMVYLYFAGISSFTPQVMTFVTDDGSVSVCNFTDTATHVYEYSADLRHVKTMQFKNEFPRLGAFAKDNQGNYYFFYADVVNERQYDKNNMALVKYDSNGRQSNILRLPAQTIIDNWSSGYSGVKKPFWAGACKMEISGDMLAVYFARQMFNGSDGWNHQASYGFIVNKNNLERLTTANSTMKMPSASHSFDQFILPDNNGFIFADQGDKNPRSFAFAKVQAGKATKKLNSFTFKEGTRYQQTYAQLGGLAQTSDGYLFVGTYEKSTSVSSQHNDSRNVFAFTLDDELNNVSAPIWVTNYRDKNNENAANPKIAALNAGRFLLMWELMGNSGYKSTYMTIVDKTGKLLTTVKELPGIRLSINDVLRYNRTNGNVYWAIDNDDKNIDVYSFNPDNPINVPARTWVQGDSYGLTLRSLTVDKRTVSQNEKFAAQSSIRNSVLNKFKGGQIGAALVDNNGNIVEVIGTSIIDPLSSDELHSRSLNCTVPITVKPGQYRLRIVIKPTGGEWRAVTMTKGSERMLAQYDTPLDIPNAIPITVTAAGSGVVAGSYELVLEKFTVDKTSVPQNQLLTLQSTIRNSGVDNFSGGQIGGALVDNNGGIATVIGITNFESLKSGTNRSNTIVYCTVPNTVNPGQYNLRMVTKHTGGEWKVITITNKGAPDAIPITVTAGSATIGAYGVAFTQFKMDGKVSAVSYGEKFSLSAKAVKAGVDAYPGGKFGVALVGGNNIIAEVIYSSDWKALDPGAERSLSISKISVPNSVAPGKYNLMAVVRAHGGDWQIATMSAKDVPTSIELTVRN